MLCLGICARSLRARARACAIAPGWIERGGCSRARSLAHARTRTANDEQANGKRPNNANAPAGMRNLGATCYVAAVLQCLYALRPFRAGVYTIGESEGGGVGRGDEGDGAGSDGAGGSGGTRAITAAGSVLPRLRSLFARLQLGGLRFVDPMELVRALQLDRDVQQDGHEFMKLLLGLLERHLAAANGGPYASAAPDTNTRGSFIAGLFSGLHAYRTQCLTCGRASEASRAAVELAELELNVQGFKTLEESLDDWCAKETLDGDNRFHCDHCGSKQPATRGAELYAAPPALCVQLKRFVFDLQTLSRKKVTSLITAPLELDLARWITPVPADMVPADAERARRVCADAEALAATAATGAAGGKGATRDAGAPAPPAKRQKGASSASSKSPWVYDLHAVLLHKGGGTASGHYVAQVRHANSGDWWQFDDEGVSRLGSHLTTADVCAAPKGKGKRAATAPPPAGAGGGKGARVSSSQAYMLMYVRRGANDGPEPQPPASVASEVQAEARVMEAERSSHARRVADERAAVEARREEVRRVLAAARMPLDAAPDAPFRWVATEWLRKWADGVDAPGAIDNAGLLCKHGKVPPSAVPRMRRITVEAWRTLQRAHGGGPELCLDDRCTECMAAASSAALAERARGSDAATAAAQVERLLKSSGIPEAVPAKAGAAESAVVDLTEGGPALVTQGFFVTKRWAKAWVRQVGGGKALGADAPCEGLLCEHGHLAPRGPPRLLLPAPLWKQVRALMPARGEAERGPSTQGVPIASEVASDTTECPLCAASVASADALAMSAAATAAAERERAPGVAAGKPAHINVTGSGAQSCVLLPGAWVDQWRAYLSSAAAARHDVPPLDRPRPFDYSKMLCTHGGLMVKPPPLVVRKGGYAAPSKASAGEGGRGALAAVAEVEAEALAELYPPPEQQQRELVRARVEVVVNVAEEGAAAQEQTALVCSPAVCMTCLCLATEEDTTRRATFAVARLRFRMIPADKYAIAEQAPDPAMRATKRRRARKLTVTLDVGSALTLGELSLAIMAETNVNPRDQRLLKDGIELKGAGRTLFDCRVTPESELEVVYTEDHQGNEDLVDLLDSGAQGGGKLERGFAGTALTQ